MVRLYVRKIEEQRKPVVQVTNCPLELTDEYFCKFRCPMRGIYHCVYRIVEIFPKREELKDVKCGQIIFAWRFRCCQCDKPAAIYTITINLAGSQGSCAFCGCKYVYFRHYRCEGVRDGPVAYYGVSKPLIDIKKAGKKRRIQAEAGD